MGFLNNLFGDNKIKSNVTSNGKFTTVNNTITLSKFDFSFMVSSVNYVEEKGTYIRGKVLSGNVCENEKVFINGRYYNVDELVVPGSDLKVAKTNDEAILLINVQSNSITNGSIITKQK